MRWLGMRTLPKRGAEWQITKPFGDPAQEQREGRRGGREKLSWRKGAGEGAAPRPGGGLWEQEGEWVGTPGEHPSFPGILITWLGSAVLGIVPSLLCVCSKYPEIASETLEPP